MCQIWVQRSHFWRLLVTVDFDDSFITEVWSVDHIIIVNTSMVCAYGGLPKCAKFTCSTLHSSQVMLWGLKRAMSGHLVTYQYW